MADTPASGHNRSRRQSLAVAAGAIRRKSIAVINFLLDRKKDSVKLKKVLSVWDATAYIVCTVVGAGIFVSPKNVLLYSGSPGAALAVWLFTGLITTVDGAIPQLFWQLAPSSSLRPLHGRVGTDGTQGRS